MVVDESVRLSRDADPRVRAQALSCLVLLAEAEAGPPLPLHTFAILPEKLQDEAELVRLTALPLLHHFATHYPEEYELANPNPA